jgi:hypothetical protein
MGAAAIVIVETDDRFYIAPSTIPEASKGLFAKVELDKGDRLRMPGVLVRADSVSDYCTSYADAYKVRAGDYLLIPVGWGAIVNHNDDPNVEKIVEHGEIYLRVIQPIRKDQELFCNYDEYAQKRFGPMFGPDKERSTPRDVPNQQPQM